MGIRLDDVVAGMQLPAQTFPIGRVSMVRYAGASGDFNPIHWSEEFATSVGLPNVIAHGMLTMAITARVVTEWTGDPGGLLEYGVRFTRPVVVPYGETTLLEVTGSVIAVDPDTGTVVVELTAAVDGETVLTQVRATVRCRR